MKSFIAYFDYLGYKEFILNNNSKHHKERVEDIQSNIENALAKGKISRQENGSIINDIMDSSLTTLNISDTVLFWTKDDSKESFKELIEVCYEFNRQENCWNFPVRGAIIYDEIYILGGRKQTNNGGIYNANTLYGKGIVNSHIKAESQNWAGTVIDHSLIKKINKFNDDKLTNLLKRYAIKYNVPYKNKGNKDSEYVLKLTLVDDKRSKEQIVNMDNVKKVFERDNKSVCHPSVVEKITNTLDYVRFLNKCIGD
jgi:hypothetical protein